MDCSKKGLTSNERFDSAIIAEPSRAEPSRAEPSRAEPSRAEPLSPPRARECCCPPLPDRLPPRRGGRPSLQSASAAGRRPSVRAPRRRAARTGPFRPRGGRCSMPLSCRPPCPAGAGADHELLSLAHHPDGGSSGSNRWSQHLCLLRIRTAVLRSMGSISTSADFGYPPWNPPHKHHCRSAVVTITVEAIKSEDASGARQLSVYIDDVDLKMPMMADIGNVTLWLNHTSLSV